MRTVGNAAGFAKFRMVTFSLCTNPLPVKNRKGFLFLLRKLPFFSSLLRNQKTQETCRNEENL